MNYRVIYTREVLDAIDAQVIYFIEQQVPQTQSRSGSEVCTRRFGRSSSGRAAIRLPKR